MSSLYPAAIAAHQRSFQMVKVQGPMMSMGASGKLGGAMVFSKWKGRPYVRELVKPANPRSGGQVSMRAMMRFLSQEWNGLGSTEKATWAAPAAAKVVSNFNAYTSSGARLNRSFLAPSQSYPVVNGVAVDAIDTFTATAGVREISIVLNQVAVSDAVWGFLLFWSTTTGFTPAFSNLLRVIPANGITEVTFVHGPLDPDTYYYDAKPFGPEGFIGALDGEVNATVA
jgi:hypothetical protein